MWIGMYRPVYPPNVTNTPEETAILRDFANLLEASDSEVLVLDEIQRVKFRKNIWWVYLDFLQTTNYGTHKFINFVFRNAVFGACATLVRYPLPAFFRDVAVETHVIPQLRAMMLEILAIGRAMGFDESALPAAEVDDTIRATAEIHKSPNSTHRPSMLLDLDYGHPMEVEVVLGELIRKAREHQVDTPVRPFAKLIQVLVANS